LLIQIYLSRFSHLWSNNCNQAGLLKLIEIAMCDRGCRDNSVFLHSIKRQRLTKGAEMDEQKQEVLDAIEDLVTNSMADEFICFCGHMFTSTAVGSLQDLLQVLFRLAQDCIGLACVY
jgi:hypothetical protein